MADNNFLWMAVKQQITRTLEQQINKKEGLLRLGLWKCELGIL